MHRLDHMFRAFLAGLALIACLISASPAHAQQSSAVDEVVTALQSEGYTVSEIKRTWLGRILIVAQNDTFLREVVLNRRSGRVIEDQSFVLPDAEAEGTAPDGGIGLGIGRGVGIGAGVGVGVGEVGGGVGAGLN